MRFDFVNEENKPYNKRSKATRHLIRKRATEAAAKTKKAAREIPHSSTTETANTKEVDAHATNNRHRRLADQTSVGSVNAAVTTFPSDPIEFRLSCRSTSFWEDDYIGEPWWPVLYGSPAPPIQPQDLLRLLLAPDVQAVLIGNLLSRYTLKQQHVRVAKMLGLTSTSFVSLVPDQYGRDPCLDAAIDCLGSRIQEFLTASKPQRRSSTYHYGRALQQLQSSLENSDGRKQYDLCLAIPLLCLYELLDSESQHSWLLHARGAAVLLKHIGPNNITSNIHKTLLMTLAPVMINETLFRGETCYLEEPEWAFTIKNAVDFRSPDFSPRSELVASIILMTRRLPGLFIRVEDAILSATSTDIKPLLNQLAELNKEFDNFYCRWSSVLSTKRLHEVDDEARIYHLATVHTCSAVANRLLFALRPSGNGSVESAALRSATLAHEIANHAATSAPNFHARMAFPAIVASSIVESSSEWAEYGHDSTPGETIDLMVLQAWSQSIGRLREEVG